MKYTVKILALLAIVGLSGCATNGDLAEVKALAQQANATADAALKTARSAENTESKIERMAKDQAPMHK